MNCTFPPELRDAQLLTYIDGEASPEISTHLAGCAACQVRAQELARLQKQLSAGLFRVACPPSLELGEYQAGLLEPEQAATIRQHLTTCHHCARELGEMASYLAQLSPVFVVDRWQQLKTQTRVLVAQLVDGLSSLGGGLAPAPVGIRGEQDAPLIYEEDDVQVIIEIQPDAERLEHKVILGLILGVPLGQPLTVQLWQEDQVIATTTVDEAGNFIFSALPAGGYALLLTNADLEVHLHDVWV